MKTSNYVVIGVATVLAWIGGAFIDTVALAAVGATCYSSAQNRVRPGGF